MNKLPISRKVNKDINERIHDSLSFTPESETEARRLLGLYLEGSPVESGDMYAMIAFNMVKPEIDRAMARSKRARERAAARKAAKESVPVVSSESEEPAGQEWTEEQLIEKFRQEAEREYEAERNRLIECEREYLRRTGEKKVICKPFRPEFVKKYVDRRMEIVRQQQKKRT